MKPHHISPRKDNAGGSSRAPVRIPQVPIPQIPMEWMDPMSWRLPSGKALAEFALQTGFLAPLMLGRPVWKRRNLRSGSGPAALQDQQAGEAPERSGSFRETQ